ncbi:gp53-like domain-containing protein [Paraburkholderia dilworthii]|uniref:gp53-like domain-containing protein n=1 Tax=Paraburkholderia dilworthii TaxID=948106 RepID=UPI0003F59E9D|nr:hypothetical protein [Paraburkholderia dilworthii]
MTIFIFANNINTTLAGAVSNSAGTITLSSTQNLPASIPAGKALVLTLNDAATRGNYEIVYATAISGATLTVLRGQDGTSPLAWLTGDFAFSPPTAGQQMSFGQLADNNTWSGNNTFSNPVAVGNAASSGQAITLGQADATFALLAGMATQQFDVAPPTEATNAVNLGQFVASLGGTGYFEIPVIIAGTKRNLVVQYGTAALVSSGIGNTSSTFNLPIPFPNSHLWDIASFGGISPPIQGTPSATPSGLSQVQLSLYTQSSGTFALVYLAIGF